MKNIKVFFYGLTLLLSLVSFSAITQNSTGTSISTVLVINELQPNTKFSIDYRKVKTIAFLVYSHFNNYAFQTFKNTQNLHQELLFKSYSNKTLCIKIELQKTKLYTSLNTKILYEDFIV